METFRFTRALFGVAPSPFLLAGVIKQHLETCRAKFPDLIREIVKSLYVDDFVSGGPTVREAQEIKAGAIDVFGQASIKLHKWHSNVPELEAPEDSMSEETTFAKEQLGTPKAGGGSILGLTWNKDDDILEIKFPADHASVTKRGVLGKIARVYDPLGLVSPMTLSGKLLYRKACESKVAWDAQLPGELASKWIKWESQLPSNISVPRVLPKHRERISNIELHCFGDASGRGISVAVYAVVSQPSGDSVVLVAAKSRLAKQGVTIPRLELVSGHMATNLIVNVKESLEGSPVGEMFCWLDSSVALHWIKGSGSYKQLVSNCVHKIQQRPVLTPNSILFGRSNVLPEKEPHRLDNKDLRKRARHLKRCKEAVWKRWTGEYVKGLRERHRLKNPGKPHHPEIGEVVLIKSEDKNRGKWKIGIVTDTIEGRDDLVRAVKLRVGTSRLERAVQHLFPLELSCDHTRAEGGDSTVLRAEAPEFRPTRDSAVAANLRIRDVAQSEEDS